MVKKLRGRNSSLDSILPQIERTWYQIKYFRERVQTKNDTQLLRQPLNVRANEGGLECGEMEKALYACTWNIQISSEKMFDQK